MSPQERLLDTPNNQILMGRLNSNQEIVNNAPKLSKPLKVETLNSETKRNRFIESEKNLINPNKSYVKK